MKLTKLTSDGLFYLALLLGPIGAALFISFSTIHISNFSLWFLVSTIVIYPVLEEIIFRGQLQAWLLKKPTMQPACCGISIANLITSLLFTSLHILYRLNIVNALIIIPSLIFGFFYERYSSVIPSIVLHICYNVSLLVLL